MKTSQNISIRILLAGLFLMIATSARSQSTALSNYLASTTGDYEYELVNTLESGKLTQYELLLTSQEWKGYTWQHRLVVLAPKNIKYDQALLYIGGGRTEENGKPHYRDKDDGIVKAMGRIATEKNTIVATLFQVPNQPIFGGLVEDEIISYTLHQFQETGDETWPLLFPMVKSVEKAMDAVQDFSQKQLQQPVSKFLLTGLSKRGWTTWLTGSQDKRVNAIAPMVIDVLNMPVSLQYQIEMWKDYSPEIQDYVDLGIPQNSNTGKGKATISMVDPYSYKSQLGMPKLVFVGTNDPYWPVDAAKNYWDDIPGDNDLVYIPNVGHDLGNGKIALYALAAFLEYQCLQMPLPSFQTSVTEQGSSQLQISIHDQTAKAPKIELWQADSEEDWDFRDEEWTSTVISGDSAMISLPVTGQKSFYLAIYYSSPSGQKYYISSKMYRCDSNGLVL